MRRQGVPSWLLLGLLLCAQLATSVSAHAAPSRAEQFLPLPGGSFLRISAADIAIGAPGQRWRSIPHPGISYVTDAAADREGVLVAGSVQTGARGEHPVILLIGGDGQVLKQWQGQEGIATSLASHGERRVVVVFDKLFSLAADGTLQRIADVPFHAQILLTASGRLIVCVPNSRSAADFKAPSCKALEEKPWHAEGAWSQPPISCGAWIIEAGAGGTLVRKSEDGQVVARSSQTGRLFCRQGQELILLSSTVRAFSLPALTPRTTRFCGSSKIIDLAVTADAVVALLASGALRRC